MTPKTLCIFAVASFAFALAANNRANDEAKDLPEGPGKELVASVCIDCHTAGTFRKMRMNEAEWVDKVGDMVDRGAKADEKQQAEIVAYLLRNFGPDAKANMNTAPHSELMVVLGFTTDEAKSLVAWRTDHGSFKDWSELLKVPGVDAKKLEAQKNKMTF